jgi:single-stranded-DNA-specific exonuclease
VHDNGIGVIDAGSNIDENFIGTVTTITMSDGYFTSPVAVGLAHAQKDKIKVSSRAKKEAVEDGLNLGEVVETAAEEVDGEGGGHNVAAGAMIPRDRKQEFMEQIEQQLSEA